MATHNGGMTSTDALAKAYREGARARARGYGRNHYKPGRRFAAWRLGFSSIAS
jgi:hypothetical protein